MITPEDFDSLSDRPGVWTAPPTQTIAIASTRNWRDWAVGIALIIIISIAIGIVAYREHQAQLERTRIVQQEAEREQQRQMERLEAAKREAEKREAEEREAAKRKADREEEAKREAERQEAARREEAEVAARREADLATAKRRADWERAAAELLPKSQVPVPKRYTSGEIVPIELRNLCYKEAIFVAIHYRAIDGSWMTAGWWQVSPGATVFPSIQTNNSVIYAYAYSKTYQWPGSDITASWPVIDDKFDQDVSKDLFGSNKRAVQMRAVNERDEKLHSDFTCN